MLVVAVIVLLAAVVAGLQLAIPRIAAARVRARLTEAGGTAEVSVRAFPATRLLRNAGSRIEVRGRDLEIGLASGGGAADIVPPPVVAPTGLSALDGFTEVDIELVDFRTGPFAVAAFVLERSGAGSYAMATRADTSAAELAGFGLERLRSIPGAGLLGSVAGPALGSRRITVSVQIELASDENGLRVTAGGGTIAGYPAGPLATTIAAAVARRLEIVP